MVQLNVPVFCAQKTTSTMQLTEFFHRISPQMVSAPGQLKNQRRQVSPGQIN